MNKPYSGNGKPFVLALFADGDRKKVLPVLEALEKKQLTLCGQDGRATSSQAKKACTTIVFLSENFAGVIATKNKGQIMKAVMPALKGKADGKAINAIVAEMCQ